MLVNANLNRSFLDPQFNSDEARLRKNLLEGYVPEARPVVNISTVTIVDIGLTIIQVMDLVIPFGNLFSSDIFDNFFRMNKIKS